MTDDGERVEDLLQYLKTSRGFDFTAYRRSSLVRRIQKRLQTVSLPSYDAYQGYLENHPEEFSLLFNTILINVTNFFRDAEAWKFVATEIVPRILADTSADNAIRVWSAGCASGEEAYTLAMILVDQMGVDQFRRRVKIYASDLDEEALTQARHATYSAQHVQDVPPEQLKRYFERVEDRYVFHQDLRRAVIFGRHDLVHDAPIARVHLLVCRNTLMYFTREVQTKVLGRFHYSLQNGGYLFMGRAELLLTHGGLFAPVQLKSRVFSKAMNHNAREHIGPLQREEASVATADDDQLHALTLENDSVARVMLRTGGTLPQATNEELETMNEELQATNEELDATNEELQSTNEELETMNEELQATNEELETTNTQLRLRSDELNHANAFLASIVAGLEFGVVVVDPRVQVVAWNHRSEDMWGLRADEVQGRHLMNLDIGLPVEQLSRPIHSVLSQDTTHAELSLDCVNRRGRSVRCDIRANPLLAQSGEILGVILLMEERAPESPVPS